MTEVAAPKYPEDAVAYDVWDDGAAKPATVSYLWTIVPGSNDQPNRLYVVTEPGGLFQSHDRGETFCLVEGLWNHPSRRKNWFGGATWEGRNKGLRADYLPDPYAEYGHDHHYLAAAPSNPDVLWQQDHFGVFRSANRGRTWPAWSLVPSSITIFGAILSTWPVAWNLMASQARFRSHVR